VRLFIIECLNPMDLLQDRSEAAALEGVCRLLGHEVAPVSRVQSRWQLSETCKFIASIDERLDARDDGELPLCVHIAAHGNSRGLGVGSRTVTWDKLADAILPLGSLHCYSGPLIVVISACDAGQQSLTSELAQRRKKAPQLLPPAYVFVTCDKRLAWTASVAAWTVFYHLIQDADLDRPESIREVLTTVRASGGAVLRYHRWDDNKRAYLKYEPKAVASLRS
jgi:hypothetical protein